MRLLGGHKVLNDEFDHFQIRIEASEMQDGKVARIPDMLEIELLVAGP